MRAQRLLADIERYASTAIGQLLRQSLNDLARGDYAAAVANARQVLDRDSRCVTAWRLTALALEAQGDLLGALEACQETLRLEGDSQDLLEDLGRLAMALDRHEMAVQFLTLALNEDPASPHLAAQLASALSNSHDYRRAVEVLGAAIAADAHNALLWNALGEVSLQQGEAEAALVFFERALGLDPTLLEALYNRANVRLELNDAGGALADCDQALALAEHDRRPEILFVRALTRLSCGDLKGGWADYEARLDPDLARAPLFSIPGRRWTPEDALPGRRLLVVGEQGIGDEIMFAGMLPDAIQALGATGALLLAVEPRLTDLFQRSFPQASVRPHATDKSAARPVRTAPFRQDEADFWTPMAGLARRFRPDLASFEQPGGYLVPDPDQTARWRTLLAAHDDRPKVGIVWKSLQTGGDRRKQYAPFEAWLTVLRTLGVCFVNLQYGDCDAELALARAHGIDIWTPPRINLTNDIDGAAALSASLDLLIGVGNASTNLAGACGVPVWLSLPPAAWPRLGAPDYPWFAKSRVFVADRFGEWAPVMSAIHDALQDRFS